MMDLEKTYNRLCKRVLPPEQCKNIAARDEQDASRYAQIDKILAWFAELRAKGAKADPEKIGGGSQPETQTSG